jgi:hypothetical protein
MARPSKAADEPIDSGSRYCTLVRRAHDRADHSAGKRGVFPKVLDALGMGFDS